jgi:hypothetical protein
MTLLGLLAKNKTRPTRAELIKYVLQYFAECQCESDVHTIREKVNGYTVTITRSVDENKAH